MKFAIAQTRNVAIELPPPAAMCHAVASSAPTSAKGSAPATMSAANSRAPSRRIGNSISRETISAAQPEASTSIAP